MSDRLDHYRGPVFNGLPDANEAHAMSSVILEFDLPREDVRLHEDRVTVELGNGVRLTTGIPTWVKGINAAKPQIVLDIEGGPPDANTEQPPKL